MWDRWRVALAAKVGPETGDRAAALAIGAAVGSAAGVLFKLLAGAKELSYDDAGIIGAAAGVGVVVVYLLI